MSENFGQIPDKVRYNNELTFFARLIYSDILSLAKKENFCFATNQYFAGLYNVSQKTVSISIKELEKEFCISVELTKDSKGTYRKITPLRAERYWAKSGKQGAGKRTEKPDRKNSIN